MRHAVILAIVLITLLAVSATSVLAAAAGRTCTYQMGTTIINPECGVKGSNTSVYYFPWFLCEDSSHRGNCDDDQLFIQQETYKYTRKGADPCGRTIYKEGLEVYACKGHPLPGVTSDWTLNPPP